MPLTQEQEREHRRGERLQQFFTDEATTIATYVPFGNEVTVFNDNMDVLEDLIPDKDVVSTGVTTGKNNLRKEITELLVLFCGNTHSFALKKDNSTLAAQMDVTTDTVVKLKEGDVKGFVKNKTDLMRPLIGDAEYDAYLVTTVKLDELNATAETFDSQIGSAAEMDTTVTVANADIEAVIDQLHLNYEHFDLLKKNLGTDFVIGYNANSKLDDLGVRHSGAEGTVTAPNPPDDPAGAPVGGVTVKLLATDKQTVTDLLGHYAILKVKAGLYEVEFSKTGYVTQKKTVKIRKGNVLTLDALLVKL